MKTPFDAFVLEIDAAKPDIAFVLGSGMGGLLPRFDESKSISFAEIPGLAGSSVVGHSGQIALGKCEGRSILLFRGRLHYYEGHPWERVTRPMQYAAEWGIRSIVLTNAAGGIRDDLHPGSLMAIENHFGWLDPGAWRPSPSLPPPSPYSRRLLEILLRCDAGILSGVYGGVTGPTYETPAEIRALRAAGADAVGMSTVREAETAHRLGMEVAAISLITNKAAGLSDGILNHKEVLEAARTQESRLSTLIEALCERI